MRRGIAGLTVVACMLLMTQAAAVVEVGMAANYLDKFSSVSYSGSDGMITWDTSWKEIGEADGPSLGAIQVKSDVGCPDGTCIGISGDGGAELVQLSVARVADLSRFLDADLCYDVRRVYDEELKGEVNAVLYVQVYTELNTWKTLKSFNINTTDAVPRHESHGIDGLISGKFALRFAVEGSLAGAVFIDNVEIKGHVGIEPTSTTTTKPTVTTKPTTTTTEPPGTTTTTTTTAPDDDGSAIFVADRPPPDSGIRDSIRGLQADYDRSLFGADMMEPEVLAFEVSSDYLIATEAIESSWMWMAGLGAIIAWAVVSNMDRRRRPGVR